MYTLKQRQLLTHAAKKIKALFRDNPAPAHEYDHSERVRKWILEIGKAEHAKNLFLLEFMAIAHDIGRALEPRFPGVRHHELSYRLLREWFRDDAILRDGFSKTEKMNLLYSIRYHWNSAATKYREAIILRDADRLDMLGSHGVKRVKVFNNNNVEKMLIDLRFRYDILYWIQTLGAQEIIKQKRLIEPITRFMMRLLKQSIKPVEV